MTMISIEDAQAKLPELIGGLAKGEELVITDGGSGGRQDRGGTVRTPATPGSRVRQGDADDRGRR